MFSFHITAHCLACGRELPVPKMGTAERVMKSTEDDAEVFLETEQACPQCGKTRVRVRMEFEMAVDVEVGGKP